MLARTIWKTTLVGDLSMPRFRKVAAACYARWMSVRNEPNKAPEANPTGSLLKDTKKSGGGRSRGVISASERASQRGTLVALALETYRKLHLTDPESKLKISKNFDVPHDSKLWPSNLWGMKLGILAKGISKKNYYTAYLDKFRELGLTIESDPKKRTDYARKAIQVKENIVLAVATYRQLHNVLDGENPLIPSRFVVPSNSPQWPEALWGMKLGEKVKNIFYNNTHADYRDRFESLGLFAVRGKGQSDQLFLALETYRKVHSIKEGCRLSIPVSFVVPNDSPEWPSSVWGFKLGKAAFNVVYNGSFSEHREQFAQLGLVRLFQGTKAEKVDLIVLAVETYKKIHKIGPGTRVVIPQNFTVPSNSTEWPRLVWDLDLGRIVYCIVYKGYFRDYADVFRGLGLMQKRDVQQQYLRIQMR